MKENNTSSQENQDRRLLIKTKSQQIKNIAKENISNKFILHKLIITEIENETRN